MKKAAILFLMSMVLTNLFAQNESGVITIEKNKFYQNEIKLKRAELHALLQSNPEVLPDFEIYKKNYVAGSTLTLGGLALVCAGGFVSLSSSLEQADDLNNGETKSQSDYSSGLALAGLGLVAVIAAVPINLKSKRHLQKSVELYNAGLQDTAQQAVEFDLQVSGNQVSLIMRF